jgi:mRNA-degrading endonuclease RelE of RelBE toxin-antitoxin system
MREAQFHPAFKKDVKGLDHPVQRGIQEILARILENPEMGDTLSWDLEGIYSYHFQSNRVEYRVAYTILDAETVFFIMVGIRENFYESLKRRI